MTSVLAAAPSENWDDDFEFQARTTATTNTNKTLHDPNDAHRTSIASSDWDHDDDHNISTILEDKKNTAHLSPEWIEPGPSTPRRTHHPQAENWDDDFEDSPARRAFPSPPGKEKTSPSRMRRVQNQQLRPESWDDEFDASPVKRAKDSPTRTRHVQQPQWKEDSKPQSKPLRNRNASGGSSSSDDEKTTHDLDFGYVDRDEEDRTVTARSRRTALSRLSQTDGTPPPPVPTLPLPFLLPPTNTGSNPSPSPRSPTSSVFSVPTTYRPPSSSAYTVTSTTHLRPTASRSSSGLGALPPSPPIHRERERRRLRKKSRPQGPAIELGIMRGGRENDVYDYRCDTEEADGETRPQTPPPPPVPPAQSVPATPSGTGGGAGALLSRIGSVKKWGVRRKRGSTTPGEVMGSSKSDNLPPPRRPYDDSNLTPRPHSQASVSSVPSSSGSSNAHRPFPPPQTLNGKRMSSPNAPSTGTGGTWFFRTASSSYAQRGSTSDVSLPMQVQPHTPKKDKQRGEEQQTPSPAKLVKRKSLGFVQLRRGLGGGGHGDDASEREQEREKEKENERYAGLGLGRAVAGEKEKDVYVADAVRDPEPADGRRSEEQEKDGSRSFMGSVRRLSLVGRHKRTKSGVSLSNVAPRLDVVGVGVGLRDETVTPTPKSVAAAHASSNAAAQLQTPTKPTPRAPAHGLLPPIELQPPSPPRLRASQQRPQSSASNAKGIPSERMLSPISSTSTIASTSSAPPTSPSTSPSATRRTPLGSPQAASLGRSTIGPTHTAAVDGPGVMYGGTPGAMRRSSLGDLKIPERISQAQVGLRKDMERVREFAAGVEQLKELQLTYDGLVTEVQAILDAHAQAHAQQHQQQQQQHRATSPSFFANLPRPMSRNRSNTNPPPPSASTTSLARTLASNPPSISSAPPPNINTSNPQLAYKQLASAYYTIKSKYRISWECAELLIDLGSGTAGGNRGPTTSVSAPLMASAATSPLDKGTRRSTGRERAITLGGEDSKPSTPVPGQMPSSMSTPMHGKAGWRASTGKHDLSQRQLVLLKDILNGDAVGAGEEDRSVSIPEEAVSVNREWRWGKDAMSSTITLPSEDSSAAGDNALDGRERDAKLKKKRRASRLGMTGLRDMLRSLKRSQTSVIDNGLSSSMPNPTPMSSTSLSTTDNSSMEGHRYPHARIPTTQRRRAKTSSGPDSVQVGRPTSPYSPSSLSSKPSPRRPSLASIFRLGQKAKPASPELLPELRGFNHYHNNNSRAHTQDGLPRSRSVSRQESSSTGEDEEDWDRMDDASDVDAAARVLGIGSATDLTATVRGKGKKGFSPYLQDAYAPSLPSLPGRPLTPKRSASGSQSSIWGGGGEGSGSGSATPPHPPLPQHARTTRLSNVEEHASGGNEYSRPPQPRASSRGSHYRTGGASPRLPVPKSGSVRSMPPQFAASALPDPTLAMTPENIRPLLENAREVQARLMECISEIRALLAAYLYP